MIFIVELYLYFVECSTHSLCRILWLAQVEFSREHFCVYPCNDGANSVTSICLGWE